MRRIDAESETLIVAHALRADGFDASEDGTGRGTPLIVSTLDASFARLQGASGQDANHGHSHLVPVAFDTTQVTSKANRSNPQLGDPCHPLAAGTHPPAIAFSCKDSGADAGDLAPTLRAMEFDGSHANAGGQVAVAFQESQSGCREYESAGTVRANGPGHDPVGTRVRSGMAVRRLTPMECERLQGYEDGYTAIPGAADGPRYRSLGNSMAVNVMRWLGRRILEAAR